MNWFFIVLGNLIMDSAIVLFAILSGFESLYWRKYESGKQFEFDITKQIEELKKLREKSDGVQAVELDKIVSEPEYITKLRKKLNERILKRIDILSPLTGKMFLIIIFMFFIGVFLQIFGIFFI